MLVNFGAESNITTVQLILGLICFYFDFIVLLLPRNGAGGYLQPQTPRSLTEIALVLFGSTRAAENFYSVDPTE